MSAHTPGPWYIGEQTSFHGMRFIEIHSTAKIGRIKMPAHLLGPVARTDRENARLIAAAPELLEALQDLLNTFNDPAGLTMSMVTDRAEFEQFLIECEKKVGAAKDRAAAVIAKATGEQA